MEGILKPTVARRVLFLTQWFDPEPAFKGIGFVKALRDAGFSVDVVTGFPNYPRGKLYSGYRIGLFRQETMDGIPVRRLPLYPSHGRSAPGRMANYLSFFVSVLLWGLVRGGRYDVAYVYHPPITVGLATAVFGRVWKLPFILDIQDLWPDSVEASGMGRPWIVRLLNAACNFVYERAARIVAQSRGMATELAERGVPEQKLEVIYNWADEVAAKPSGQLNLAHYSFEGQFNIIYGGNIGRFQQLDIAVQAAMEAAKIEPAIRLLLVGDGVEADNIRALATTSESVVMVAPAVPRNQVGDIFGAADVLLIHLADDPLFRITVPQKTQFYMATGKPIVAGMAGEVAQMIIDADAGIVVPPGDIRALAAAFVKMVRMRPSHRTAMGSRGLEYYRSNLSFYSGIYKTSNILNDVISSRNPK